MSEKNFVFPFTLCIWQHSVYIQFDCVADTVALFVPRSVYKSDVHTLLQAQQEGGVRCSYWKVREKKEREWITVC